MQRGDFVTINYTAKIKDTQKVFDTTCEDTAREEGIHTERAVYGPITIILGAGHVISGLEKILLTMDVGEKREVDIEAEDAFGTRDRSLLVTVPLKEFRQHGVLPKPSMRIEINNKWATVRSVSSGRVTLDFNHPLSGKTLHYFIQVIGIVENTRERIEALLRLHNVQGEIVTDDGGFEIKIGQLKKGTGKRTENILKKEIKTFLPDTHITINQQ
jgi:FKBP-type peptidyl-prolyl cis-trans isomerase SlyD